jgi:hypothetical protein
MMARSSTASSIGRIQKRKTELLQSSFSACNARPVHTDGSIDVTAKASHQPFFAATTFVRIVFARDHNKCGACQVGIGPNCAQEFVPVVVSIFQSDITKPYRLLRILVSAAGPSPASSNSRRRMCFNRVRMMRTIATVSSTTSTGIRWSGAMALDYR